MKVLKFGGTSLGSPDRMKNVAKIVSSAGGSRIVVLSAVSGTTNALVEINELHRDGKVADAINATQKLRDSYTPYIEGLFSKSESISSAENCVKQNFDEIERLVQQPYFEQIPKVIVSKGEVISTNFFNIYLEEMNVDNSLIGADDFMYLDKNGEPDLPTIERLLTSKLEKERSLFITQGFVCRNSSGGIDNLKRGGSDYSATLIGAAIKGEEVQIWTDIDGMHNNDPRVIKHTKPISKLSFEEAGELAYFGAKILHPHCIVPAHKHSIPVRIKNTLQPELEGTLITDEIGAGAVKAIAAKDKITAVKVKSSRMIMAYGFLRKVFEVFEKYKTSIDMITTSEIAVSLTIDDQSYLSEIAEEIREYGKVEVDKNQTIICIVGDLVAENAGVSHTIFKALKDIPIRMISYGGSRNNISVLIDTSFKSQALSALHHELFD